MNRQEHTGRRDRIRKRFVNESLDYFEEHEVLELLLYYAIPMRDTNTLAHRLIQEFGSLSGVLEAPCEELIKKCRITRNTAILITMIPGIARKYLNSRWGKRVKIVNSGEAGEYAATLFTGRIHETFYVINLDNANQIISAKKINEGTINETHVYPRLIVETALASHANSIILAHNHPGGTHYPSNMDIEVTHKIMRTLREISIHVIDHIVVAGEKYYSMAENGYMGVERY